MAENKMVKMLFKFWKQNNCLALNLKSVNVLVFKGETFDIFKIFIKRRLRKWMNINIFTGCHFKLLSQYYCLYYE